MLLLTAANDSITDEALKSRFDIVQWPLPKKSALVKHALKLARESEILGNSKLPDEHELNAWIEESKIKSFRHIEANLEQFVLSGKKSGKNLIDLQIEK